LTSEETSVIKADVPRSGVREILDRPLSRPWCAMSWVVSTRLFVIIVRLFEVIVLTPFLVGARHRRNRWYLVASGVVVALTCVVGPNVDAPCRPVLAVADNLHADWTHAGFGVTSIRNSKSPFQAPARSGRRYFVAAAEPKEI
jgi:hypothetical protein